MTGKEWLAVYEQSGEMPPAGVLARQLAAMDNEIEALKRRNAELTASKAVSGLNTCATKTGGRITSTCAWCAFARRPDDHR